MTELDKLKAELAYLRAWCAHLHKHANAPPFDPPVQAQDDPPIIVPGSGGPGEEHP